MMKFLLDILLLHKKKKKKKKKTTKTTTTTTTEENAAMAAIPISYITASQLTKLLPSAKLAIIDVRCVRLFSLSCCFRSSSSGRGSFLRRDLSLSFLFLSSRPRPPLQILLSTQTWFRSVPLV
jgi:hypothetical protein